MNPSPTNLYKENLAAGDIWKARQIAVGVQSAVFEIIHESLKNTVKNMQRDYGVSLKAETMIHSDQGSHYTSVQFIQIVNDIGLRQSMSRRGNCWDNAPQESFYGHDHIIQHRGDQRLFWDQTNWESLCKECHDKKTGSGL